MGKIRVLPENLINQIAAGEVIDRPASVIKELVENSIDAGATKIKISVVNGGVSEISVSDNGSGISEDDIENAFKKHATSKIQNFDDLFNIHTLGFRGEALASIASISKIIVETKTAGMKVGNKYKIVDGKVISKSLVNREIGTTIIIDEIFYNIPARKKFLKSAVTEKNHILQEIYNIVLLYHEIDFEVLVDGKKILSLVPETESFQRYRKVFDLSEDNYFFVSDDSDKNFVLKGHISLPEATTPKKGNEYIFVNGRQVKDQLIRKAVTNAFIGFIPSSNYPNYFIQIDIQPQYVDVNVHPKKQEVKWEDTNFIFSKVMHSIKSALERKLRESVRKSLIDPQTENFHSEIVNKFLENTSNSENGLKVSESSENFLNNRSNDYKINSNVSTSGFRSPKNQEETQSFLDFSKELFDVDITTKTSKLGYLNSFQLFQTYIVLEYSEKVQIIDQHAAAERIKYDKLLSKYNSKKLVDTEDLLVPLKLNLSNDQLEIIPTLLIFFAKFGIEIEKFGFEYIIRAFPKDIFKNDIEELILDIINDIIQFGDDFTKEEVIRKHLDKIISTMACHNSIRAGYSMNKSEIEWLIKDLMETNSPYSCPHGRPIIWELSKNDLEKRFGRVK